MSCRAPSTRASDYGRGASTAFSAKEEAYQEEKANVASVAAPSAAHVAVSPVPAMLMSSTSSQARNDGLDTGSVGTINSRNPSLDVTGMDLKCVDYSSMTV